VAAQEGHLEVVRALLEGGVDANQADKVCAFVSWRASVSIMSRVVLDE